MVWQHLQQAEKMEAQTQHKHNNKWSGSISKRLNRWNAKHNINTTINGATHNLSVQMVRQHLQQAERMEGQI